MTDIIITIVVTLVSGILGFVALKYGKPYLESKIDTEAERYALEKGRKITMVAHDMVMAEKAKAGNKKISIELADTMLDALMLATDVSNKDVAKRVLLSTIEQTNQTNTTAK